MAGKNVHEYIVVGSGPGGATIARELAKAGKIVLIVEAGKEVNNEHLGSFWSQVVYPGYYKKFAVFNLSREGATVYCTENFGGTSVVSSGNMVRSLEAKLLSCGIKIDEYFMFAEAETKMEPVPGHFIIGGTKAIGKAAKAIGIDMKPMPKGVRPDRKCDSCGECVLGCRRGHKWDARGLLDDAKMFGAQILGETRVEQVLWGDGVQAEGVVAKNKFGERHRIMAENVILSAGGLGTPAILRRSGIEAGQGLFVDFFNTTCGLLDAKKGFQGKNITMGLMAELKDQGFILSPFLDHWSQQMLLCPPGWNLWRKTGRYAQLGIMAKIADERCGEVFASGAFSKYPTKADLEKLKAGAELAAKILSKAGADSIITSSHPRGAHPGGTAAIGEVVDENLRVLGVKNLYVCDASVFPEAPGKPPILAIIAIAKYLAVNLLA